VQVLSVTNESILASLDAGCQVSSKKVLMSATFRDVSNFALEALSTANSCGRWLVRVAKRFGYVLSVRKSSQPGRLNTLKRIDVISNVKQIHDDTFLSHSLLQLSNLVKKNIRSNAD